jgi:Protein of unknown function (DUF541)
MRKLGFCLACTITLALPATALAAGQQISVNGTGGAAVPNGASNAQQLSAYDQALAAAIGDAQTKALAVAHQLSLPLGPVQTFTEQSSDYLGYCGIGFLPGAATGAPVRSSAPAAAGAGASGHLTLIPAKHKKHRKRHRAHKAQTSTCQIEAAVTIVYSTG